VPVPADPVALVLAGAGLKEPGDDEVAAVFVGPAAPVEQPARDPPLLARELRGRPQVTSDIRLHEDRAVAVAEHLMAGIGGARLERDQGLFLASLEHGPAVGHPTTPLHEAAARGRSRHSTTLP